MKRFTTVLCSIAFLLSGIVLSLSESPPQNTITAAPAPIILHKSDLPLDLQLNLKEQEDTSKILRDTIVQHDTVHVVKYKYKYRTKKVEVLPDSIPHTCKADTLYVPAMYFLIQVGKEEPTDTIVKPLPEQ